jgi:predicted RNase H-like nuclease
MAKSTQRAVLGIDAAWTERQPSGVAAAVETPSGWRLAAVAASYENFIARANGAKQDARKPTASAPVAAELLDAARRICGACVDLVAVDMPMARAAITGRRFCDRAISAEYGARAASTHSPSAERPGKISDPLRAGFEASGYLLCVSSPARGLIEVYPHPALIEFLEAPRRLEYKAAKIGKYWPGSSAVERHKKLREVWRRIVDALEPRIQGVRAALPPPDADERGSCLKAYEDKLDAVVCAAVAIASLKGEARGVGDENAAIWIPAGCARAAGSRPV